MDFPDERRTAIARAVSIARGVLLGMVYHICGWDAVCRRGVVPAGVPNGIRTFERLDFSASY